MSQFHVGSNKGRSSAHQKNPRSRTPLLLPEVSRPSSSSSSGVGGPALRASVAGAQVHPRAPTLPHGPRNGARTTDLTSRFLQFGFLENQCADGYLCGSHRPPPPHERETSRGAPPLSTSRGIEPRAKTSFSLKRTKFFCFCVFFWKCRIVYNF